MLASRWETGVRRYELTLKHDYLCDLLLRRAWAGNANRRGADKMQVFLDEQAALREVECTAGAGAATTWCELIIHAATG